VIGWTNGFMVAAYSAWLMTTAWQASINRIYSHV
jgi:hypothetical protein